MEPLIGPEPKVDSLLGLLNKDDYREEMTTKPRIWLDLSMRLLGMYTKEKTRI